eukprot:GFUD01068752.1.p1 GENE.GFUD01068752.1~~GFUD01068752.1.p1  ORF type:complete len:114 (-),score=17.18 GFUD01068752.1:26-367(-)
MQEDQIQRHLHDDNGHNHGCSASSKASSHNHGCSASSKASSHSHTYQESSIHDSDIGGASQGLCGTSNTDCSDPDNLKQSTTSSSSITWIGEYSLNDCSAGLQNVFQLSEISI